MTVKARCFVTLSGEQAHQLAASLAARISQIDEIVWRGGLTHVGHDVILGERDHLAAIMGKVLDTLTG